MSDTPNRIELNNGGYLLFDFTDGKYRVACYTRKTSKSETLNLAIAYALGLPAHNRRVKEIAQYINSALDPERQLILD